MLIKVKDLLPGSCYPGPDGRGVYEGLTSQHYRDTLQLLIDNPEAYYNDWPIHPHWGYMCQKFFKGIPDENSTPENGRCYAHDMVERTFRKLIEDFREANWEYNSDKCSNGERFQARIGATGKIYIRQGNKRTNLLYFLKGPDFEIEVDILSRHEDWEKLKHDLFPKGKKELYQPLPHPDFQDWPITQPCEERWQMVTKELRTSHNFCVPTVLDLGCHTGFFCRKFSRLGCPVQGIDNHYEAIQIGKLSYSCEYPASLIKHDVMDYLEVTEGKDFDCCLCLSLIFHLFGNYPNEKVWEFLDNISRSSPIMFLDCVWGGYTKRLPFSQENIQAEIIKRTQFNSSSLLGRTAHENHPFYVFHR